MKQVLLIGGGGHAKVIIELIEAMMADGAEVEIAGYFDDVAVEDLLGYPRLGCVGDISLYIDDIHVFVASIGSNTIRKRIVQELTLLNSDIQWLTCIHPSAVISKRAILAEGTVVMPGAVVNASAKVGKHSIINTGAVIEHDCILADFVHVSPNATLCGAVLVGEGTQIGAGATVIQCKKIGADSVIGAGALVSKDIIDHVIVKGVPAK